MDEYRPRLRAHLQLDGDVVHDRLLGHTVTLTTVVAAVAGRLDGETAWTAIRAAVGAAGHRPDEVDGALRALLALLAVEGAGDALLERLSRVVARQEPLPTLVLGGARFACQGSGACCEGYRLGPLSDDDVARLAGLDLAAASAHVVGRGWHDEGGDRYLDKRDDRCVFLDDERRCGLHARFGADAKPAFCRLYPLDTFATVAGVWVVDRGTCACFATATCSGAALVDELPRLRPLLAPPRLRHPLVLVDDVTWDHGLYLRFVDAGTALVRAEHAGVAATVRALGRLLASASTAVRDCPLAPGQPEGALDAALAAEPARWYQPATDVEAGVATVVALLAELAAATSALARDTGAVQAARARALASLCADTAAMLVAAPAAPVASTLEPALDAVLRISLRQQLVGRQALVGDRAGAGLLRLALIVLLSLAGARRHAGARALVAADLDHGHVLATRWLHAPELAAIVVAYEPRWRLVLDGLERAVDLATRVVVVR